MTLDEFKSALKARFAKENKKDPKKEMFQQALMKRKKDRMKKRKKSKGSIAEQINFGGRFSEKKDY